LSRGGYNLLERKIIEEKAKSLHDSSTSEDVLSPPSPPSRHEKWKLARTKPGGQMTSTQSEEIAYRVMS